MAIRSRWRRPLSGNNRAIAKLSQPKIIVDEGAKFNKYCEGVSGWRHSKLWFIELGATALRAMEYTVVMKRMSG
jgi:hypothetical protein